jgi:hypothetical protein
MVRWVFLGAYVCFSFSLNASEIHSTLIVNSSDYCLCCYCNCWCESIFVIYYSSSLDFQFIIALNLLVFSCLVRSDYCWSDYCCLYWFRCYLLGFIFSIFHRFSMCHLVYFPFGNFDNMYQINIWMWFIWCICYTGLLDYSSFILITNFVNQYMKSKFIGSLS